MNLQEKADHIRAEVIRVAVANKAGHIAPSLSCVEILVALYYQVMKPDDLLIFSKAHGGYGLYAVLADLNILPKDRWEKFTLPGCVERMPQYGIIAGCGALGHGLPMATGLAFGNKLQGKEGKVYCIVGDGEMQEGSNWEAVQFAVHHELENLIVIIDDNGLQAMDKTEYILNGDLFKKFEAFGMAIEECNGHEFDSLYAAFYCPFKWETPTVIIANTVKGKGLPCAEGVPKFHFRIPTDDELSQRNN